jgi:hypothetical protein
MLFVWIDHHGRAVGSTIDAAIAEAACHAPVPILELDQCTVHRTHRNNDKPLTDTMRHDRTTVPDMAIRRSMQ